MTRSVLVRMWFTLIMLMIFALTGKATFAADSIIASPDRLRTFSSIAFNRDAGDY